MGKTKADLQNEYQKEDCDNLGTKRDMVKYTSNGLTYGGWCDITKSQIEDFDTKELIVVGKIEIRNKTWNKTLEVPDNLLQLQYEPKESTSTSPATAHLSNIPHGTKLGARKTITSDIRIQVTPKDANNLGILLLNDKDAQTKLTDYDEVPIKNM